jgi:type III pantothenate kinase
VPLEVPHRAIGRDTVEAIASGVMLGHREAVGGLVGRMAGELRGRRPIVVLTGGDAEALGAPDWADRTEPTLLLRGLGMLAALRPVEAPMGART